MPQPVDYLLIGHITADLTSEGRRLGGTVSYAARIAAAFGRHVGVLTSAAPGEPLLREVEEVAQIHIVASSRTTTFENIYEQSGRRQVVHGRAATIGPDDIPDEWRSAPLVHLAPVMNEVDPRIVYAFPNAAVMVTPQGWLRRLNEQGHVLFNRWCDEAILNALDVLVCSEEDIRDAPDLEQEYASAIRHLVVTRAEKGGIYYHEGEPRFYPTPQVEQRFPTGAGDVFAASLLCSLPRLNNNMWEAVLVAARLAATSVARMSFDDTLTPRQIQDVLGETGVATND